MKEAQDKFSKHSEIYRQFRPRYPQKLYEIIISLVNQRETCWDCGTGNGQVATELAGHFRHVYATDISRNQLDKAEKRENITYKSERAEQTLFPDDFFDLITVAQAVHWFDLDAFGREVKRVAKDRAVLAAWGYGLLKINSEINPVIDQFYREIIGPFWNEERKHIDREYQDIRFGFEEIEMDPDPHLTIQENRTLEQLEGYFNSWSAVQNYKQEQHGKNPVDQVIKKIEPHWKPGSVQQVTFPLFLKLWRVGK